MKPFWALGAFFLFAVTLSKAQSDFPIDKSLPVNNLDENSRLTLLNSRLGSRFSCSFASGEYGLHTGALGFDNDQSRQLLIEIETPKGRKCFRTGNPGVNTTFLQNQTLRFGISSMQLRGESAGEYKATFTLVSPFTPSDSLTQTDKIKVQIAPLFYWLVSITNNSGKPLKASVRIGFNAVPFDRDKELSMSWWRRGKPTNSLFFRDIASPKTLLAIAGTAPGLKHFDREAWNGLTYDVEMAAKATASENLIYATHHAGKVMTEVPRNESLIFTYNRYWKNIDEVLAYGAQEMKKNLELSAKFEDFLNKSTASPEEKWVIANSFHTDLANSMLLDDSEGKTRFYLTEGRFRHMNTMDVAHETELMAIFCPWRLKLQLEQWSNGLATKEVSVPSGRSTKGIKENTEGVGATELGPYLFHDVGNFPYVFNAEGYDFGPFMPVEENSNFVLLLYWYWKLTGDDAFVKRHLGLSEVLMQSMVNRDSDNSGIADYGLGWSTYDVSEAIKRSPENVNLGVKQLCAYVCGSEMLKALPQKNSRPKNTTLKTTDEDGTTLDGNQKAFFEKSLIDNTWLREKQAEKYLAEAAKILSTLQKAEKEYGHIPVSLDKSFNGWNQHSIVIADGFFLPGISGNKNPTLTEAAKILGRSYEKAYAKSKTPYGMRLSSDEEVTWFSKVMVSDMVASYWFGSKPSSAVYAYNWNKNNNQSFQDGAFSLTKEWPGNWYPRGVCSLAYLLREKNLTAPDIKNWLNSNK